MNEKINETNEIRIFENEEFGRVRSILNEDGSISINAEDAAIGFGWTKTELKNGREYTSIRWERMNGFSKEIGFDRKWAKTDYIPESLFYRLGMKANNEKAEKFQNWLAMEVIPTLRKTGYYSMSKPDSYLIEDPAARARRWAEEYEEKKRLIEEKSALEEENKELAPKAAFHDVVAKSKDCIDMEQMAKILRSYGVNVGRNRLYKLLREGGILMANNLPYQKFIEAGYFQVREYSYITKYKQETRLATKTLVTPKGQQAIVSSALEWGKEDDELIVHNQC